MRFVVPNLTGFPEFLKKVESKWKMKLMRRFDRERYVGLKEEQANKRLPRYILSMFPYPSGRLHLGHVRIYTSGDILARYSRLLVKNENYRAKFDYVINPMGFDSFGLPAENAARERGLNPAVWTNSNIRSMKQQLDDLALQFDWREATSNPSFYKWTQEIFLRLLDAGLAYKSFATVNWDPIDKTVLADEQVDEEGRSWRSGALVEKRYYRQWFIKVNAFVDDIYSASDIDPETWGDILSIQRNWIGKPSGWLFYLQYNHANSRHTDIVPVFTKRPELFLKPNVRLIISKDHWLEKVHNISSIGRIVNPFTCCELGISTTDQIDDLPPNCGATLRDDSYDSDTACPDCDPMRQQVLLLAKLNGLGGFYTSDKYRDWLVSRQRFWGTPIPTIRCKSCGDSGVARESLPVSLPNVTDFQTKRRTSNDQLDEHQVSSPLEELAPDEWLKIDCPSCGSAARRECDTFDTLFDSSWYFLRYASSPLADQPFDPDKVQPVWCYVGGKEHASMHLFYARFITHFLHSQHALNFKEPFEKLLVQGVVKSKTHKSDGRYLSVSDADGLTDKSKLVIEYEKMSKSKGNGVDPQDLLDVYGIDATRFCLMSYTNPRTERLWRTNEEEFRDVLTYLRRVAMTVQDYNDIGISMRAGTRDRCINIKDIPEEVLEQKKMELATARNNCSIDATFNLQETNQFRQYISSLHTLLNPIRSNINNSAVYTREFAESLAALLVMLNPIVPNLSEELWSVFSQCHVNPLKTMTDTPYRTDMQASDQPWPLPDDDHPLIIKVRPVGLGEYVDKIPISKEYLRTASKQDLAQHVESHFYEKGDTCEVRGVQKFDDLMAIVEADIGSVKKLSQEKRRDKKKKHFGSQSKS